MSSYAHTSNLSYDREEVLTERVRRQFRRFVPIIHRGYTMKKFHQVIAEQMQLVQERKIRRLMLTIPPQHGKSQIATRNFPAYALGRNNREKVVICSYSAALAEGFNQANQRTMLEPTYQVLFPDTCIPRRASGAKANTQLLEIVDADGKPTGGFIKAVGRGGSLTGTPMDIGIIDDPLKDRMEANSLTIRENLWQWYTDVFETRMHNESVQIVIQTRWHQDDLAGRLLERDGIYHEVYNPNGWVLINFEAIKTENENRFDERQVGEALWPDRHSLAKLEKIKADNKVTFNSLYQGDPKPNPENLVFPDWIQIDEFPRHLIDVRFFGLDFGFTNDPTTVDEIGKSGQNLYFQELIHDTHLTMPMLSDRMEAVGMRKGRDEIIADSSDPRSIETLFRMGWNIRGSIKGPDSISAGISKLDEFKCHYTKSSRNIHHEQTHYEWVTIGNKRLNIPIETHNHHMDGIRGAVFTKYHGPGKVIIKNRARPQ